MRIDCHVHYKAHARDRDGYEEAMVRVAIAVGLNAIVFTEHHQRLPAERIAQLNEIYKPFRIFSGVEVATDIGDVLVFGDTSVCWSKGWLYENLRREAIADNYLLCLAHPMRKGRPFPRLPAPTDFVEVASRHIAEENAPAILMAGTSLKSRFLRNSDAHKPKHFNSTAGHWNEIPAIYDSLLQTLGQLR